MSSLSPNYGRTRRTSRSRKSSRRSRKSSSRSRKSSSRSRKTQSLSPTYRYSYHTDTSLFELCKHDFFSVPNVKFEKYKTIILSAFEKYESIVNNTNKKGETPLDLLCKQYNDPKNSEEFVGFDDRQSLLSLIEDLQGIYGAKLKKCRL